MEPLTCILTGKGCTSMVTGGRVIFRSLLINFWLGDAGIIRSPIGGSPPNTNFQGQISSS